jgi:hypothetical protein
MDRDIFCQLTNYKQKEHSILTTHMKKTLTVMALLAGVVTGYSQGVINFQGNTAGFKQVIYNANSANTGVSVTYGGYTVNELQGSTSTTPPETPTGNTVYAGSLLTGTGYSAELLGAPAPATLAQLVPLTQASTAAAILNFYTGGTPSGTISGSFPVVTASGATEQIAIAAWNNEGGTVTSLAAAQLADSEVPNSDPWGISALSTIVPATGANPATLMSTASALNLSFSLGTVVPEPSTIALGVMGASALLFRRRK